MESKISTRKIVLLAIFVFLLAVCIIQGIVGSINPVKTIKTNDEPNAITITKDEQTIELLKKNNTWLVGKDEYIANKSDVEKMIKEIQEIKILDKVARSGNAENDEKYNLTESKQTVVKAFKNGKEIQSFLLGKTSSTGSQTYACIANSKDIVLLSGNVLSAFNKDEESLRGKTVYAIEESEITGASVTSGAKSWTLTKNSEKSGKNSGNSWSISGVPEFAVNAEEAQKWIRNVAFMNISGWISDDTALPAKKLTSFQLFTKSGKTVSVELYEKQEGENTKYIGTCSETSHKFELTKAQTDKFTKEPDSLKASD